MRWLDSITDSMDMNLSKLWGIVEDRGASVLQSMESQNRIPLSDWKQILLIVQYTQRN